MRKTWFAVIVMVNLAFWQVATASQVLASWKPQQVFSTQKADIWVEDLADLQEMARRLGNVGTEAPGQPDFSLLATKIDGMLTEISRVLQKWPLRPAKLQIRVFKNGL